MRQNDLQNDVIGELPEAEDVYTNKKTYKKKIDDASKDQVKNIIEIGNQVSALAGKLSSDISRQQNHSEYKTGPKKADQPRQKDNFSHPVEGTLDKARGSLFGTLQFSGIHDYDSRLKLM
jgi:hypothetical protein